MTEGSGSGSGSIPLTSGFGSRRPKNMGIRKLPEMEVTEIISAKIYIICQLSSRSRGFFARVWILKSIGPSLWIYWAQKTPSYDTNMLAKVVFDKTEFVKFKISNNFKQNMMKNTSKQPKIHRKIYNSIWILKISREKSASQRSPDFCQIFVTFPIKNP